MFTILLSVAGSFLMTELMGYAIHRAAHSRWSGPLYRAHLQHHLVYPAKDFLSDEYRKGESSFIRWFIPVIIVFCVTHWALLPWFDALTCNVTVLAVALWNSYIHDAFHIRGHWLERFRFFRKQRIMHRIHHANVHRNISMYLYVFDKVFGTLKRVLRADR